MARVLLYPLIITPDSPFPLQSQRLINQRHGPKEYVNKGEDDKVKEVTGLVLLDTLAAYTETGV